MNRKKTRRETVLTEFILLHYLNYKFNSESFIILIMLIVCSNAVAVTISEDSILLSSYHHTVSALINTFHERH
jgi:hypothetical protein